MKTKILTVLCAISIFAVIVLFTGGHAAQSGIPWCFSGLISFFAIRHEYKIKGSNEAVIIACGLCMLGGILANMLVILLLSKPAKVYGSRS